MDKVTGEELKVNGKQVTAQGVFKAKEGNGTVDVTFLFDGSTMANHDIVVFERLYHVDGERECLRPSHKDLEDKRQTIKLKEVPREVHPNSTTLEQP